MEMAIRLRDLVPADCGATPEQLRGHDCFTCRRKARISTGSRACGARSRAGYVHAVPAGLRSWATGSVPPSRRSRVKIAAGSSKTADTPPHEEGRCPRAPSRNSRWATGRGGGLAEVVVFSFCKKGVGMREVVAAGLLSGVVVPGSTSWGTIIAEGAGDFSNNGLAPSGRLY